MANNKIVPMRRVSDPGNLLEMRGIFVDTFRSFGKLVRSDRFTCPPTMTHSRCRCVATVPVEIGCFSPVWKGDPPTDPRPGEGDLRMTWEAREPVRGEPAPSRCYTPACAEEEGQALT